METTVGDEQVCFRKCTLNVRTLWQGPAQRIKLQRPSTAAVLICCLLLLQYASSVAAQTAAPLDYEERIRLAHQIMDPIAESASETPDFRKRYPQFVANYALVNPKWTANYLHEALLQADSPQLDFNAMQVLMQQAGKVEPAVLKQLIKSAQFMRPSYALQAIKSMSDAPAELRREIIELGIKDSGAVVSPVAFVPCIELARLSGDPALLKSTQERIETYWSGGQAAEMLQTLPSNQRGFMLALWERFAPESAPKLTRRPETNWYSLQQRILSNDQLTDDEKRSRLRAVKQLSYGSQFYEIAGTASQMGAVALLDSDLALKWAAEAPHELASIWAEMVIARAIAKNSPERATDLVRRCFVKLRELSTDPNDTFALNVPPYVVAAQAMPLVAVADRRQLPACSAIAVELLAGIDPAVHQGNYLDAITALAPYAPRDAKVLFDRTASDVNTGYAANFFRALLAVSPSEVWQEYESMPRVNRNGIRLRSQIRNAIIPALAAESDSDFWHALAHNSWLTFPTELQ